MAERGSGRLLRLVAHQCHYDLIAFWRNRQSRFFTLALPILFLVIFAAVFSKTTVLIPHGSIKTSVYYVPNIIALGIISASFVNLTVSVTTSRENGVLKRRRATPVPSGVIIAGRALTAVLSALGIAVALLLLGLLAYHADVPGRTAPALLLAIVVGALSFCCLGYALTTIIRDADSSQPVTQAVVLPLYFISGVFIPANYIPHWLGDIARFFPVRHLASALLTAYSPYTVGNGFAWGDLAIVAGWGAFGLLVALRFFSWTPRGR